MDLFIEKMRLKLMLRLVAVAVAGGLLVTWYAWGQIGPGGQGREQFLLAATVTGALVLAWVVLLLIFLFAKRVMNPAPATRAHWWSNIPWWVIKSMALCGFIAAMAVVLHHYSGQVQNEFTLLREGKLSLLQEQIAAQPALLERLDKESGKTLLELALESNNAEAVDMLLSSGAELALLADRINLAASLENLPMLGTLLRHGMDPNKPDAGGMAPIHYAVANGNTNALAALLEAGEDVNARDPLYQTPLLLAIMADDLPMAGTLLGHGADPDLSDRRGDTALHMAARRRRIESVRFLLARGADPRIFNFTDMCPVHIAALNGQDELVELLLERPDMIRLRNEKGLTPLGQALRGRHYDTARLLLRRGADINRVMANGYTALHLTVIAKDYNTAQFLVEEGAEVHMASADGETAYDLMRKKQLKTLLDLIELRDHPPEAATTNAVDSSESP